MDKRFYISVIILLFASGIKAQKCTISGEVTNTDGICLENVSVWYKVGTGINTKGTTTDIRGHYELEIDGNDSVKLYFSCVGYETQCILFDSLLQRHVLDITLCHEESMLEEIEIAANVPLGVLRNDTTVYYASAYKVHSDATAYDLIAKKLPGINMRNGKLEAHGEEVKEILVDGKEFFKSDIVMALKNLPASIIQEVQLFDKETDYARITGFNDGDTRKAINIVTKDGTQHQLFGKVLGGYGTDDCYKGYGMVNHFQGERRVSAFAQSNNINEQNFSTIDLLSVMGSNNVTTPGQSPYNKGNANQNYHPSNGENADLMTVDTGEGINQTNAVGLNYTDELADGRFKISGHYMYNQNNNHTDYEYEDEYFIGDRVLSRQDNHYTQNHNNRLNLKLEYAVSPNDVLIFRPSIMHQNKVGNICQEIQERNILHTTQDNTSLQKSIMSMNEFAYLHRMGKRGSSLGVNVKYSYSNTNEFTFFERFENEKQQDWVQNIEAQSSTQTLSGTVSYMQVLNRYNRLKFELGGSNNVSSNDRRYVTSGDKSVFYEDLNGWVTSEYEGIMSNLCYIYSRRKLNIMFGNEIHLYSITNDKEKESYLWKNYKTYPYAQLKYTTKNNEQLYLQYKTSKIAPTALQLQEAVNNTNPLLMVKGNIKLAPSYRHALSLRYVHPDTERANIFIFFANYEAISNHIACSRTMVEESQNQSLTYANMDGYQSFNALTAYGFPFNAIRSNVNVSSSVRFSETPACINNSATMNRTLDWNNSLTIGSNISETIDFVVDINTNYHNDLNKAFLSNDIRYWSFSYGGQINWSLLSAFKLIFEGGQTQYYGMGLKKYNALICNAALAYKFLHKRNAEILISVNDAFNQNNSFTQTTNEIYKRTMSSNVIGRYAMFTFTYNL